MTFPFECMPNPAEEHRLHLVAGPTAAEPLRHRENLTDETGALVFSMLTLDVEDHT